MMEGAESFEPTGRAANSGSDTVQVLTPGALTGGVPG